MKHVLGIALILLMLVASPITAVAQAPGSVSLRQEDIDGDGDPDLTIIAANLGVSDGTVHVYDAGDTMIWSENWQEATDFVDDTWLYDSGADGSIEVVVQFRFQNGLSTALLFGDQDDDGSVVLVVDGAAVSVLETRFPDLVVQANGGWYLPDGQLNWNVRFLTDGNRIYESLGHYNYVVEGQTRPWVPMLKLDGETDSEFEFRDDDRNGIPEYGLWRLLAPTPEDWSATRTFVWSNEAHVPPNQPQLKLFWPYLVPEFGAGSYNYFENPPVIAINWDLARLSMPLFLGYPIEQGYHINTETYFEKNTVNYTNFENMQAYYDLAADQDGFPEMHIRHRYFRPFDVMGWNLPVPLNEIRWSWNQDNAEGAVWSYKLGLAGRNRIRDQVDFPDFSVETIPYESLPSWILAQSWDFATFVASETTTYTSTEGIYDWAAVESILDGEPSNLSRYLAGEVTDDPRPAFNGIARGNRGEFAPELQGQPRLYFSPIDGRLHLKMAEYCIWQVEVQEILRCIDRDQDGYFDGWQYQVGGQVVSQLNHFDPYLIFSGDNQVILKANVSNSPIFEVAPPVDHTAWAELGQLLSHNRREIPPYDLAGLVSQFQVPTVQITGGGLQDFQLTPDGFQFLLRFNEGFRVIATGEVPLPELTNTAPGDYMVQSRQGQLRIDPVTPPDIVIDPAKVTFTPPEITALNSVRIGAVIENRGLTRVSNLKVRFILLHPERNRLINEQDIELGGASDQTLTTIWAPPGPGDWTIRITVENPDVQPESGLPRFVTQEITVHASPHDTVQWSALLSLEDEQPLKGAFVLTLICALSIIAGALFGLIIKEMSGGIF